MKNAKPFIYCNKYGRRIFNTKLWDNANKIIETIQEEKFHNDYDNKN